MGLLKQHTNGIELDKDKVIASLKSENKGLRSEVERVTGLQQQKVTVPLSTHSSLMASKLDFANSLVKRLCELLKKNRPSRLEKGGEDRNYDHQRWTKAAQKYGNIIKRMWHSNRQLSIKTTQVQLILEDKLYGSEKQYQKIKLFAGTLQQRQKDQYEDVKFLLSRLATGCHRYKTESEIRSRDLAVEKNRNKNLLKNVRKMSVTMSRSIRNTIMSNARLRILQPGSSGSAAECYILAHYVNELTSQLAETEAELLRAYSIVKIKLDEDLAWRSGSLMTDRDAKDELASLRQIQSRCFELEKDEEEARQLSVVQSSLNKYVSRRDSSGPKKERVKREDRRK